MSWWQQTKQRSPDILLLNHILHLMGHPKTFPGQIYVVGVGVSFRTPVIAISSFLSLPKSHDHRFEFRRVGKLIQTFLCSFLGKLCIKVPKVPNTEKNDAAAILDAVLLLLFHYLPLLETQTEPSPNQICWF